MDEVRASLPCNHIPPDVVVQSYQLLCKAISYRAELSAVVHSYQLWSKARMGRVRRCKG